MQGQYVIHFPVMDRMSGGGRVWCSGCWALNMARLQEIKYQVFGLGSVAVPNMAQ